MRKISKNKILILAFLFILMLSIIRVDATMGNINSFIYSSDYFYGDYSGVNNIAQCFRNKGISAEMMERPKSVYGMQQYFKYSESVYISTHGILEGGVLVLDGDEISPTLMFKASDVPKDMECKLVYMSACYSAKTSTDTRKNLCSAFISNGYKAAIGYTDSVSNTVSKDFEREFYCHISKGESMYSSLNSAKIYIEKNNLLGKNFVNMVQPFGDQSITLD